MDGDPLALEALRIVSGGFQSHVAKYIAAITRQRNAKLPIHCLPPEILGLIFRVTLDFLIEDEEETNMAKLHPLALVCHRWHHIVKTTPSLWTNIGCNECIPASEIRQAIRLSGQMKIDVKVRFRARQFVADRDETLSILECEEHHHRWRSLQIRDFEEPPAVWTRIYNVLGAADSLESLDVRLPFGFAVNPWSFPHLPRLLYLRVYAIHFTFPPSFLAAPALRVVILKELFMQKPQLLDVLSLLAACSALEILKLRNVTLAMEGNGPLGPEDWSHNTEIHLKCLSYIELEKSPELLEFLLKWLRPGQSLSRVSLWDFNEDTDMCNAIWAAAYRAFKTPGSILQTNILFGSSLKNEEPLLSVRRTKGDQFIVKTVGHLYHTLRLSLSLPIPGELDILAQYPLLDHDGIPPVRLIIADRNTTPEMCPHTKLLLAIPSIVDVHLDLEEEDDMIPYVTFLMGPQSTDLGWPAPRLRRFTVKLKPELGVHERDALAAMITARAKACRQSGVHLTVPQVYDGDGRLFDVNSREFMDDDGA